MKPRKATAPITLESRNGLRVVDPRPGMEINGFVAAALAAGLLACLYLTLR